MSDTTMIARVGELVARLDTALARITTLEAERCTCAACGERRRERELATRRERFATIAALPSDEHIAAINALDAYDRAAYFFAVAPADAIATTITRCERLSDDATRIAAVDDLPPALRDRALVELVRLPDLVELRLATHRIWGQHKAEIPKAVADRLAAAGISRGVYRHSTIAIYERQIDLANGVRAIVRRAELAALCEADEPLHRDIVAGNVLIRDLTDAEVRAFVIEMWRNSTTRDLRFREVRS